MDGITQWGDNGGECSKLACLPTVYYFAQLSKGLRDDDLIKANFEKDFGISMDAIISLVDIANLSGNDKVSNVCKYALYNDPLMGIYDSILDENKKNLFVNASNNFAKYCDNKDFGYIFKSAKSLSDVLQLKYDLGIRIRKCYKSKDFDGLKNITSDIDEIIIRLNEFYKNFKNQWYYENKMEGFEIQTHRIGGLRLRLEEVKDVLTDYISGKIESIRCIRTRSSTYRKRKSR